MKTTITIYIILVGLLVLDAVLFFSIGISFSGTLADQLLFWFWLAGTCYMLIRYRKSVWTKIYAGLLLILLFGAALPMGIPLVMLHTFALGKETSYRTANLRITKTFKSPLGKPYISVIRNHVWYEQEVAMLDSDFEIKGKIYQLDDVLSINEMQHDGGNELVFTFEAGRSTRKIP